MKPNACGNRRRGTRCGSRSINRQPCVNSNPLVSCNPHSSLVFFPSLVHHVYTSTAQQLCPRRLALLLMILAVGSHVDLDDTAYRMQCMSLNGINSGQGENPLPEHYHQLARASLCELPIMEDVNVDVILALFWEIWYLLIFSDKKKAATYAWGIMGLTAKFAQSVSRFPFYYHLPRFPNDLS